MMEIRPATIDEFKTAVEWATNEGWNPGLDDLEAFYSADPSGFLMGFEKGDPISSISVVRYGNSYGFLGFYIVRPEMRGSGAGIAIWNEGLKYLKGRTVGLDGVVAQQENYEKSGFVNVGRNVRYAGSVSVSSLEDRSIRPISSSDLPKVMVWDKDLFPADRSEFLSNWLLSAQTTRKSLAYWNGGGLQGYGTIRKCVEGHKIGPLFADNEDIADALFQSLIALTNPDPVILDIPESNVLAKNLAERYGLQPVFETARMYLGQAPKMDLTKTFGITTFELG